MSIALGLLEGVWIFTRSLVGVLRRAGRVWLISWLVIYFFIFWITSEKSGLEMSESLKLLIKRASQTFFCKS